MGRRGGIQLAEKIKVLSPDAAWHKNNGGMLLKIGDSFRVDVGSQNLLHMHLGENLSKVHLPLAYWLPAGQTIFERFKK